MTLLPGVLSTADISYPPFRRTVLNLGLLLLMLIALITASRDYASITSVANLVSILSLLSELFEIAVSDKQDM